MDTGFESLSFSRDIWTIHWAARDVGVWTPLISNAIKAPMKDLRKGAILFMFRSERR